MKNLLRTILTELEKHKLMFRANAYELWFCGCTDMITDWGYDQDKLIETLQEVDLDPRGGNILILEEKNWLNHDDLMAKLKKEASTFYSKSSLKNVSDEEIIEEFPREYYCGDHVIMWELWNEGIECLSDYSTGLDKFFDMTKLYEDWDNEFAKFIKGLS